MNSFMLSQVVRSTAVLLAEAAFKSRLPNHIENKRVEALNATAERMGTNKINMSLTLARDAPRCSEVWMGET